MILRPRDFLDDVVSRQAAAAGVSVANQGMHASPPRCWLVYGVLFRVLLHDSTASVE